MLHFFLTFSCIDLSWAHLYRDELESKLSALYEQRRFALIILPLQPYFTNDINYLVTKCHDVQYSHKENHTYFWHPWCITDTLFKSSFGCPDAQYMTIACIMSPRVLKLEGALRTPSSRSSEPSIDMSVTGVVILSALVQNRYTG